MMKKAGERDMSLYTTPNHPMVENNIFKFKEELYPTEFVRMLRESPISAFYEKVDGKPVPGAKIA
jgi:hypothetical protein